MRPLKAVAIVSILFAIGTILYTQSEKKRFIENLPQPPAAEAQEQMCKEVSEAEHPHSHDLHISEMIPKTDENVMVVEDNTISDPIRSQNDKQTHTESDPDWRNDETHILVPERRASPGNSFQQNTRLSDPTEMDPDELADYLHQNLIRRFGDIPEVHTFIALKRKIFKKEPLSLDEKIDYVSAQLHLFPHPETRKTLKSLQDQRATRSPKSIRIVR